MKSAKQTTIFFLIQMSLTFVVGSVFVVQKVVADTVAGVILTPEFTWYDEGGADGVRFGNSVASVDINGDGFSDAIVGSPNFKVDFDPAGAVVVYLGGPDGLNEDPFHFISPLIKGINFGISVNNAGDLNADGFEDVIIGADNFKLDGEKGAFGAAYIYYGSPTGLILTDYQILTGPQKDSKFGTSVCGVGDVDGDGYDDVLVGATGFSNGETLEGAIFLYRGSDTGIITEPFWQFESNHQGASLGSAISGVGDMNKDGFTDFAVGAHYLVTDITTIDIGIAQVFYGSDDASLIIPGWTITGTIYDHLGSSVAGAGDVDHNGYPDLVVGSVKSRTAVLFLNFEEGLRNTPEWTDVNDQEGSMFGYSIAGLGDVNLDGHPDIAVGAYKFTDNQPEEGAVFVYCGTGSGLSSTPCWVTYGNQARTEFGYSIATGGDLNNDDRKDLLVGSPIYMRDEKTKMGRAFSYHGMAASDPYYYYTYLPLLNR